MHKPVLPDSVPTEEARQSTSDNEGEPAYAKDHDSTSVPPAYPEVSQPGNVTIPDPVFDTHLPIIDSPIPSNPNHTQVESPNHRYVLPPRKNRGVPSRRYEPEYSPRSYKYPIPKAMEGLSATAKAFQTSLYSVQIPRTVDEAKKTQNGGKP